MLTLEAQHKLQITRKFPLGEVLTTPGVLVAVSSQDIIKAMLRHARCDWGKLDSDDRKANNAALATNGRLLSSYNSATGIKFWIITEGDRSVTTVLLPEEY
jgi:hypothetical protein